MQGDLNIKYKVRYNEQRVNRGDDTLESWNNPLKVIKLNNKDDLLETIQDMIYFCVKNNARR